jgi:hypothetical protein
MREAIQILFKSSALPDADTPIPRYADTTPSHVARPSKLGAPDPVPWCALG